jgi:hypothetical protein
MRGSETKAYCSEVLTLHVISYNTESKLRPVTNCKTSIVDKPKVGIKGNFK